MTSTTTFQCIECQREFKSEKALRSHSIFHRPDAEVRKQRARDNGQRILQIKAACQHCSEERGISNIQKHESSCYLNPVNLRCCEVCETPVKNYRTSVTCGYSCANKKFKIGTSNGNWKGTSYRNVCFQHHAKECVVCKEANIVEVHHYDEDHFNNDPANLVPLCPTHHQYWHSRYKSLVQDVIDQYVKSFRNRNGVS